MAARVSAAVFAAAALVASSAHAGELRVCADPNNLPFSNDKGEGFENKIADLIAHDLGDTVSYTWWAQRRGFVRNTLKAGKCDIWIGEAKGVDMVATTTPYYRSTYVFVTRADRHLDIASLNDPRLRTLVVGVQMVGNDATNTPPAHALARRGITQNVRGYTLYGDYREPNPPARIVEAVEKGDVDVAIVWGPLAGYFAARSPTPLTITPVEPQTDGPMLPMAFDIAMGVRHGDKAFEQQIDREIGRNRDRIAAILAAYHVPSAPTS